jgi:hypothetical protein
MPVRDNNTIVCKQVIILGLYDADGLAYPWSGQRRRLAGDHRTPYAKVFLFPENSCTVLEF